MYYYKNSYDFLCEIPIRNEGSLDGLCLNQPFRYIENILWAINFSFAGLIVSVLQSYTSTFKNFRIYRYIPKNGKN